ncbi:MAG TPA: hemolysin III family protein [Flavobacteriaceae bacterium]|nr:hemolysin III family protein [Flavobacteriaceae bacterium]
MRKQSKAEENLNALSHGLGVLLSLVGLILLVAFLEDRSAINTFSVVVYGISLLLLFSASTLYHSVRNEKHKHYFRIVDHISIYILIAGTYTPVVLMALQDSLGWELFWLVWGIAAVGTILKLFFTGKYEIFSTLLYLVMGWLIVFDFGNLSDFIGPNGVLLLFAGGMCYTLGIVFYAIERIPYHHVIWHVFVLGGAISHFLMIFFYVI